MCRSRDHQSFAKLELSLNKISNGFIKNMEDIKLLALYDESWIDKLIRCRCRLSWRWQKIDVVNSMFS